MKAENPIRRLNESRRLALSLMAVSFGVTETGVFFYGAAGEKIM